MEEERSNRKRKRPRRSKNRAEKSYINPKHTDNHHKKVLNKIDGGEDEDSGILLLLLLQIAEYRPRSMRAKLSGGHFRMINEKLYTCTCRSILSFANGHKLRKLPLRSTQSSEEIWLALDSRSKDPNNGGADPDKFLKAICELGFTSVSKVSYMKRMPHVSIDSIPMSTTSQTRIALGTAICKKLPHAPAAGLLIFDIRNMVSESAGCF
ncbi:hypothetical protein Vadar_004963 [Vaccinium darrowii]|nr:hypothetical protein Vadar_004963 [Vaccinium darrowii]